jgi:hypothetical protein
MLVDNKLTALSLEIKKLKNNSNLCNLKNQTQVDTLE